MKIILIDNYDSFTFNLYHYLSSFAKVDVLRNDKVDHRYILRKGYNKIVISPGPGNPNQSGNCLKIVKNLYKKIHEIRKYFSGSRLSILSIANILGQPKESTRRRVQKLIDYQLLKKDDNNGIMLGENYTKLVSEFADKTASELYRLTTRLGKINWYQKKGEEVS